MPMTAGVNEINAGASVPVSERVPSKSTLGKNDFLRLFVTRLSNQDPMAPMQDEQFIAQMAQFTQLEELQNMNSNLEKSLNWSLLLSQTINNTMATSLIGRSVRVESNALVLQENKPADIHFDLDRAAQNVTIEITDADGTFVRALRIDGASAGANQTTWDGLDASGNQMAPGRYTLKISGEDAEGKPVNARGYFNGTVDGVRYIDGQAMLTVGSVLIPLSDVLEIHTAEG